VWKSHSSVWKSHSACLNLTRACWNHIRACVLKNWACLSKNIFKKQHACVWISHKTCYFHTFACRIFSTRIRVGLCVSLHEKFRLKFAMADIVIETNVECAFTHRLFLIFNWISDITKEWFRPELFACRVLDLKATMVYFLLFDTKLLVLAENKIMRAMISMRFCVQYGCPCLSLLFIFGLARCDHA
jgi:hypothetical protein